MPAWAGLLRHAACVEIPPFFLMMCVVIYRFVMCLRTDHAYCTMPCEQEPRFGEHRPVRYLSSIAQQQCFTLLSSHHLTTVDPASASCLYIGGGKEIRHHKLTPSREIYHQYDPSIFVAHYCQHLELRSANGLPAPGTSMRWRLTDHISHRAT